MATTLKRVVLHLDIDAFFCQVITDKRE
jgi:impB/mucB/samB family